MKTQNTKLIAIFICIMALPLTMFSQENNDADTDKKKSGWYIQPGVLFVNFIEDSKVNAAGSEIPDATVELSNETTPSIQFGYYLSEKFSISSLIALPPTTTITGKGAIEGLTIGEVTFMPIIVSGNYHFNISKNIEPFIGAGLNYTIITKEEDANILNLQAEDMFGFVLRGGFNIMFSENWGFNASATMNFISTDIEGSVDPLIPGLGGAPVTAEVDVNPLGIQVGAVYKF